MCLLTTVNLREDNKINLCHRVSLLLPQILWLLPFNFSDALQDLRGQGYSFNFPLVSWIPGFPSFLQSLLSSSSSSCRVPHPQPLPFPKSFQTLNSERRNPSENTWDLRYPLYLCHYLDTVSIDANANLLHQDKKNQNPQVFNCSKLG